MNNEALEQQLSNHSEEVSHYQESWESTKDIFEDAVQQWRDESGQSFTRSHISEIEESAGVMSSLLGEQSESLLRLLTLFKEVAEQQEQLSSHLEVCVRLSREQTSIIKEGESLDLDTNQQASLAMKHIEKAALIIQQIKE